MTKLAVALVATFAAGTGLFASAATASPGYRSLPIGPLSAGNRGYVKTPPSAFVENHGPISHIIYLNRCRGGCTFTQGTINDALENRTTISNNPNGPFQIDEFAYSESMWNATVACVREVYAPFNVQIVTDDPGSLVPHHEAVVAGTSRNLNRIGNDRILGVAPGTCEPKNNVISFSLANDHSPDPLQLCWTIAQESAHAFGLDHGFECTDPMTYLTENCGQKFFRNKIVQCGEFAARDCNCGGPTQNSHATLLTIHGPNPVPVPSPTVDITSPAPNSSVTGAFSVTARAVDKRGINSVEVLVNGWKWNEVPGSRTPAFLVEVPAAVPDGVLDVTLRVCNDLELCSEDTITVLKGAACASADACLLGQQCRDGRCFWDPPTGAIGDECSYAQECISGNCAALSSGEQICTQNCFGGPNDTCPENFECSGAVGATGVCIAVTDEGGCCSTGGATGGGRLANIALGTMVGLLVTRRRQRRGSRQ